MSKAGVKKEFNMFALSRSVVAVVSPRVSVGIDFGFLFKTLTA